MFKKQPVICCICGQKFDTDFRYCGGFCCSPACQSEYKWRESLYICGEEYRLKNSEET